MADFARVSTKPGHPLDVVCCFVAEQDGIWLHRLLTADGFGAYGLEPTSTLVNRRTRRAKPDLLDADRGVAAR
jgi:transposase